MKNSGRLTTLEVITRIQSLDLDNADKAKYTGEYIGVMDELIHDLKIKVYDARQSMKNVLSESVRNKMAKTLAEQFNDDSSCYIDEETGYVGVEIIGVDNMTDMELIEEYKIAASETDSLFQQALGEVEVYKLLTGGESDVV